MPTAKQVVRSAKMKKMTKYLGVKLKRSMMFTARHVV
jgi:hypothetical protein